MKIDLAKTTINLFSVLFGFLILFWFLPWISDDSAFASIGSMIKIEDKIKDQVVYASLTTFLKSAIAIILGYLVGLLLSIPCVMSSFLNSVLSPWFTLLRIIPTIVWIPILFNSNVLSNFIPIPIILGVIFSSLYVSMYVIKYLRNIPVQEIMAMKAMKVDFYWKFRNCYRPRIVVSSIASLKLGASIAFILVAVGEALMGDGGLGALISSYQGNMNYAAFWLATIMIGATAVIIFLFFNCLNRVIRTNE